MKISGKLRFFLYNLAAAVVVFILVGMWVLSWLKDYTKHGEYIPVPSFYQLTPEQAEVLARQSMLRIAVVDSLYDATEQPGTVLEQYPATGSQVKEHRLIQLIVNSRNPEKIILPQLQNTAFRQTLQTLESIGFRIGRIEYAPSEFRNLVLHLKHNQEVAEAGTKLPKGSVIDIVLGSGYGSNLVFVPNLTGKRLSEALNIARQSYLNPGEIVPDASIGANTDKLSAFVYRQEPAANSRIEAGSPIDLHITFKESKLVNTDSLIIVE